MEKYVSKYIDEGDLTIEIRELSTTTDLLKIKYDRVGEIVQVILRYEYIEAYNKAIKSLEEMYLNKIKQNKTNTDELINALNRIKAECKKYDDGDMINCNKCPLGNDRGDCVLGEDIPLYWNVLDKPVERVLIGDGENE